jgi:hypothetical protein
MTITLLLWRSVWPVEHAYGPLAIQLLSFSAVGATIHVGLVLLLWQLSGAPPGAEQRATGIALRTWNRLQWPRARALRRP